MTDTIKNIQTLEIDFTDDFWKDYSKICKDLISHLLKKNRQQRLNIEETKNHLFFREIAVDRMNASHRHHRQKTQKKIAEEYLQTYIEPKTRLKERKFELDPIEKKC